MLHGDGAPKCANTKSNMRYGNTHTHEIVIAASGHVDDDDARTHVPVQTQMQPQLQQQPKIHSQKIQIQMRVRAMSGAWNTCKAAGDLHDFCDEAEAVTVAGAGIEAGPGLGHAPRKKNLQCALPVAFNNCF